MALTAWTLSAGKAGPCEWLQACLLSGVVATLEDASASALLASPFGLSWWVPRYVEASPTGSIGPALSGYFLLPWVLLGPAASRPGLSERTRVT